MLCCENARVMSKLASRNANPPLVKFISPPFTECSVVVTLRMCFVPLPRTLDNLPNRIARLPAKFALCGRSVRHERRRIAFAPRRLPHGDRVTRDFAAQIDNFLNARAVPSPQIQLQRHTRLQL